MKISGRMRVKSLTVVTGTAMEETVNPLEVQNCIEIRNTLHGGYLLKKEKYTDKKATA
jgi:hypothetical protein